MIIIHQLSESTREKFTSFMKSFYEFSKNNNKKVLDLENNKNNLLFFLAWSQMYIFAHFLLKTLVVLSCELLLELKKIFCKMSRKDL